jgi:tetratricopeptide (TPR) repeat protein
MAPVALTRAELLAADGLAMGAAAWRRQESLYLSAARHDPLDPDPWRRLAGLRFERWRGTGESADFEAAVEAAQQAIRRDPRHAQDHRLLGELQLARFLRSRDPQAAQSAVAAFEAACRLYPELAPLQASLAGAYAAAGRPSAAAEAARKALGLDDLNRSYGHYDKLLVEDVRQQLDVWAKSPLD